MSLYQLILNETYRWRMADLHDRVRGRMVLHVPPYPYPWQRRTPGMLYLRIYSGRLISSITQRMEDVHEDGRMYSIHDLKVDERPDGAEIVFTYGSRVVYAERHEFVRNGWVSFFMDPAKEAEGALVPALSNIVLRYFGQEVDRALDAGSA